MPLTAKGSEILANFVKEYGEKEGTSHFYEAKNAGTITGVDAEPDFSAKLDAAVATGGEIVAHCDALRSRIDRELSARGRT